MKIAILTTVHPPLDGRIFYKQAVSLAKAGHHVTYLAPYEEQVEEEAKRYGISYLPLTKPIIRRIARPKRWLEVMHILQSNRFDSWHIHDPELLPLIVIWKKLFARHTHLIYDVHEDLPKNILDKLWIPQHIRGLVARLAEQIEYWGIQHCSMVIAATDKIESRVRKATKQAITVHNYPLVEVNRFPERVLVPSKTIRVVYAGGLTPSRGIREIVQAMAYLTAEDITLLLLGEFWPNSFGQEIRTIAGINVEIVGQIPFTEVPKFLSTCDIGVVCLHATPAYIESLPIKLFEYMQAALPVVASDFAVWRQIIKNAQCGILVDPSAPQKIAEAIHRLATDHELRQKMGKSGQNAVRTHYSWESEEHILLTAYQSLAG